jgi:hypothetical protein
MPRDSHSEESSGSAVIIMVVAAARVLRSSRGFDLTDTICPPFHQSHSLGQKNHCQRAFFSN